jgi:hypothetical protein
MTSGESKGVIDSYDDARPDRSFHSAARTLPAIINLTAAAQLIIHLKTVLACRWLPLARQSLISHSLLARIEPATARAHLIQLETMNECLVSWSLATAINH